MDVPISPLAALQGAGGADQRKLIGYMMVIYIAALQNVPDNLLEAAAIDDASGRADSVHSQTAAGDTCPVTIYALRPLQIPFKMFDKIWRYRRNQTKDKQMTGTLNIYITTF